MTLIEALTLLKNTGEPVLKTHEAAAILNVSKAHASQVLGRLAKSNCIISLKRGLWLLDEKQNGFLLAPYITAPFPNYISLQSALYFHEMISQIPDTIYLITIARSAQIKTSIAHFSLHHINPDFFFGFEIEAQSGVALATPEKSLIDFLYLMPSSLKHFKALPEVELPDHFSIKKSDDIISKIPSKRTQTLVKNKLQNILHLNQHKL